MLDWLEIPGAVLTHLALMLAAGLTVLFVGDSITHGTGAAPGGSFVALVAKEQVEWTVHNAGCPGASSTDWLRERREGSPEVCSWSGAFEELAAEHADADVVHILLGANDAMGFAEAAPLTPGEFAQNVNAIAQRFSGDVVVSLPTPAQRANSTAQVRLIRYAKALRMLAGAEGAAFRIGADFGELDRAHLDGVHPNGSGHAWMARHLLRALRRLEPPLGEWQSRAPPASAAR